MESYIDEFGFIVEVFNNSGFTITRNIYYNDKMFCMIITNLLGKYTNYFYHPNGEVDEIRISKNRWEIERNRILMLNEI